MCDKALRTRVWEFSSPTSHWQITSPPALPSTMHIAIDILCEVGEFSITIEKYKSYTVDT
jgi:hypothetical protein